jgi:hypothetical protein
MGNSTSKKNLNFLEEIKLATSYRDFVMKMNSIISKKNVDWSLDLEHIPEEEMMIYSDIVKNLFNFIIEYLFEESFQKEGIEKHKVETMKQFLILLKKLIKFFYRNEPNNLYDIFWMQPNQELIFEKTESQFPKIRKVKIDEKEFIGGNEQLPVFLKIISFVLNCLFKNDFTISSSDFKSEKIVSMISQKGWIKFQKNIDFVTHRILLLEIIFMLFFVEKRFMNEGRYKPSMTMFCLKSFKYFHGFLKSLLHFGIYYNDNSVFSYSEYIFKDKSELSIYFSSLCLQLSLFLIKEESEDEKLQKIQENDLLPIFLTKVFLYNKGLSTEFDDDIVFEDEDFLRDVLEKLGIVLIVFQENNKMKLPQTLKEVA